MHQAQLRKQIFLIIVWFSEGILVGLSAILPGISGGTLCLAFGMYRPAIETISHFKDGIKKNGLMLSVFIIGVAIGFIGLSGLTAFLIGKYSNLVTYTFIGFIIGTIPLLWLEAGTEGRKYSSYISLISGIIIIITVLFLIETRIAVVISTNTGGFILCGLLWGLSFIIPGLSSSSLILFFGLYQPMLKGIYDINLKVLIPMGISFVLCVISLSKVVGWIYKKYYSIISHVVIGIVIGTILMILPDINTFLHNGALNTMLIISGAIISFCLTKNSSIKV